LQDASNHIARGITLDPNALAYAQVFAYAVIVYFSVVGFIGGYLITRLVLAPLFWWVGTGSPAEQALAKTELAQTITGTGQPLGQTPMPAGPPQDRENEAARLIVATDAILAAHRDLDKKEPENVLERHVRVLESLRDQLPLSRKLYIILGRLHRRLLRYDEAIKVLSTFLENKQRAGSGGDSDAAAAYYNRACYYVLKGSETGDVAFYSQALEDLERALAGAPELREEARQDPDFELLRDNEEFQRLTAGHRQPS
jgi:tetratricopeptide (TPR) repeat protein